MHNNVNSQPDVCVYICVRSQVPPPGKGKGSPPSVGVGGVLGAVHGLPPRPVGVGWVVGVRLVIGFVENLSTLHLR